MVSTYVIVHFLIIDHFSFTATSFSTFLPPLPRLFLLLPLPLPLPHSLPPPLPLLLFYLFIDLTSRLTSPVLPPSHLFLPHLSSTFLTTPPTLSSPHHTSYSPHYPTSPHCRKRVTQISRAVFGLICSHGTYKNSNTS